MYNGPQFQQPLVLGYMGNKLRFADQLIRLWPNDRTVYVEPFGGMAAMLRVAACLERRWHTVVYADWGEPNVNLFLVIRDRHAELREKLRTKVTKAMYEYCALHFDNSANDVERAWRYLVKLNHARYSSGGAEGASGFMRNNRFARLGHWVHLQSAFLQGVTIHHDRAENIIREYDNADAFLYLDPPYINETRSRGEWEYIVGMSDDEHAQLLDALLALKHAKVCISHYRHPMYDEKLKHWRRQSMPYHKHDKETVWMNYD